jgi:hypothetical protein
MTGPRLTPERRLGIIAEQADTWSTRMSDLSTVVPGSTLAQDDAAFPAYPVSHLVWMGLSSGVEHLELFTSALRATRTSRPSGYFTLARAGLLGAAHALWLLDEDPVQRRRRGVRMAHEDYRQMLAALNRMKDVMPAARDATERQIRRVERRIREVVHAGVSLGMTRVEVKQRINDTALITEVARRLADGQEHQDNLVAAFVMNWSRHSGNAHGLRRPLLLGATVVRDDAGGAHARVTAGVDDLAMAVGAVHLLLSEAFALYDRYRTSSELADRTGPEGT